MKTYRFASRFFTIIALCLLITVSASAVPANTTPPEVAASAAILIELNTDTILMEKDADKKIYPASLTKVMSCLVILENSNLTDMVTVKESAFEGLDEFSSSSGLKAGETLSIETLLYCIMLSSGNEACNVAAEHLFGSVDAFVAKMNTRALELGCTGTHFKNVHGLHDADHYTTARDLSIITKEALKNNTFRTIVSTHTYKMPATNLSGPRTLTTTNQLILPTAGNIYYDKRVSGVKTGFTTPAGRCLIATAEENNIRLLSIVCGCATKILPSGDLEFGSFPETKKLLDYGLNNFTYCTLLTKIYPMAEIPVSNSAGADFVSLAPAEEITALLPAGYNPELLKTVTSLVSDTGVSAPITAGTTLGLVQIFYGDELVGQTDLVAITDVAKASLLGMFGDGSSKTDQWLSILLVALVILAATVLIVLLVQIVRQKRSYRSRYATSRRRGKR